MPQPKKWKTQRRRRILFLFLFLVCVGVGIWSIWMDSNDSLNAISKLNLQQVEEPIAKTDSVEVTGDSKTKTGYGKGYSEKAYLKAKLKEEGTKLREEAKKLREELKEAINTTDSEKDDEENGIWKLISEYWWIVVGLYFFRGIFSSGS